MPFFFLIAGAGDAARCADRVRAEPWRADDGGGPAAARAGAGELRPVAVRRRPELVGARERALCARAHLVEPPRPVPGRDIAADCRAAAAVGRIGQHLCARRAHQHATDAWRQA